MSKKMMGVKKVALAYSGGLDTSVILAWLRETYGCEVVAVTIDVGQGEELHGLAEKARRTGASSFHLLDLRERFVRDYVFAALRAAAVYEGHYLLGTSMARPVITEGLMEVVKEEGCDAISHGATGKGNDQVRFEVSAYAMDPRIRVIAPWREWDLKSRSDCIAYAKARGIPVQATAEKPYSTDANLLHISYEGGILEDPWREPDAGMFRLTRAPEAAPGTPRSVEIGFEDGTPVSVDGQVMGPVELLTALNAIGGEHGVGRVDMVENRFVGMKSRGVYETPGGTLLHLGRRAVESITMDREVMHLRDSLVPRYAALVYNGFWHAPERRLLQATMDEACRGVTGVARLKLYKGAAIVTGRRAERALYAPEFATFERDDVYDQSLADGFIRLNALRLRIRALKGMDQDR
jgi:argininosuccinate synthase